MQDKNNAEFRGRICFVQDCTGKIGLYFPYIIFNLQVEVMNRLPSFNSVLDQFFQDEKVAVKHIGSIFSDQFGNIALKDFAGSVILKGNISVLSNNAENLIFLHRCN